MYYPLTDTDTVTILATEQRSQAKEARQARIAGSKTNIEYLMNAGVLVTEDDARDNAYKYAYLAERAAREGVTFDQAEAAHEQEQAEDNVRSALKWDVSLGETMAEHVARRNALMASAVGTMESGRRCKHNRTKKEISWINRVGFYTLMAEDDEGNWPFKCCRCGVEVTLQRVSEPTEQVILAKVILAK